MVYIRANRGTGTRGPTTAAPAGTTPSLLPSHSAGWRTSPTATRRFRGRGGPIEPRPARRSPIRSRRAFVEAAREKGYPVTDDFNGARFEGRRVPRPAHQGRPAPRARPSRTCTPPSGRPNLEVVTRRARGKGCSSPAIAARASSTSGTARPTGSLAEREVDPRTPGRSTRPPLLLRSGIGPAGEYAEVGIEPVRRPARRRAQPPRPPADGRACGRPGQPVPPPGYNLAESSMFLRSRPGHVRSRTCTSCSSTSRSTSRRSRCRRARGRSPSGSCGRRAAAASRLRSARPRRQAADRPRVSRPRTADLSRPWSAARGSPASSRRRTAFDPWRGPEALPGEAVQTDAELADFVRRAAGTYYHPVGTCRMGVGPDAVVDPALRVRGVHGPPRRRRVRDAVDRLGEHQHRRDDHRRARRGPRPRGCAGAGVGGQRGGRRVGRAPKPGHAAPMRRRRRAGLDNGHGGSRHRRT